MYMVSQDSGTIWQSVLGAEHISGILGGVLRIVVVRGRTYHCCGWVHVVCFVFRKKKKFVS